MEGDRCSTCGNAPTMVEEPAGERTPRWWSRIPRRTWVTGAAILVVVLYSLFQSGFRLVN